MKKTNYIKKVLTFLLVFAFFGSLFIPIKATTYYQDMGSWSYDRCGLMCIIQEEDREILDYYVGDYYTNVNNVPFYFVSEGTQTGQLTYLSGMYKYDGDYYWSGVMRLVRFPLWIYCFDTTNLTNDDKLGRLLRDQSYLYRSEIDLLSGTCNLKDSLSVDYINMPSWYKVNGKITFYTMSSRGLWVNGGIISTRWSLRNPYSPMYKSISLQGFTDNSFQLWVDPIDRPNNTPEVLFYSSDYGYMDGLKNNYIMFDNIYTYSSFTDYILIPNYIDERSEEMTDIFTTIFDTIFEYIYNFLNFNILGLNIFTALLGVVSILLLVRIIKMFI